MLRIALIFVVLASADAESIPKLKAKSLDGAAVEIPTPGNPKPLLLLVSFSRESSTDLEQWNKLCTRRYWSEPRLRYYELVDLQGVPFFVKPLILRGMRNALPRPEQSVLVPVDRDSKQWKQAAALSDPKFQHLLLADAKGEILYRTLGPASADKCEALEAALSAIVKP